MTEEMKKEVLEFLKENLSIALCDVGGWWLEPRPMIQVSLYLGRELISEDVVTIGEP